MSNWVFIHEAGFNTNLRRTQRWAPKGQTPIVKMLTARSNSISILGATSAKDVIKVCLESQFRPRKKKKASRRCKAANKRYSYQSLCKLSQGYFE